MLISRAAWSGFVFVVVTTVGMHARAASFELVSIESTGYGESEDSALVSSLIEAVRQLNGLSIESEKDLRTSLVETESTRGLKVELEEKIRSRSKGLIHSYDVFSLTRQDQRWVARLRVTMAQYRSPGLDRSNLRSIAVLPFRVKARPGAELGRHWEQKLVNHIVQARRFRVVDREFTSELDSEETRLRSGETPLTELVRIGQKIGADYLVVGEITHFDLNPEGEADLLDEASLIVEYRVIEPATREVRWANVANVNYSRDTLQRLGLRGSRRQAQEHFLNASADSIVTEILDLIYPVKVVRIEADGTILLTQGGGRVKTGQWFSIHAVGEPAKDPDTGLPVRPDGPEVVLASVVKAQDKWSWAKIEQGEKEAVKERMICRRLSTERIAAMERQAQQEQMRNQEDLIKAGRCPALVVRTFRTTAGWNVVVKNSSNKPLQIKALIKRIAGASEQTPFSLALRPGAEEAFGLTDAFATGDAMDLVCDDFEQSYKFFFP